MGGWVVTAYAAIHPKMIKRLFLLAPAGMGHELGWTAKLVRDVPIIGDWLFMATYAAQHRVLVYDHYGRGYSDRPKGDQDRAFFCPT